MSVSRKLASGEELLKETEDEWLAKVLSPLNTTIAQHSTLWQFLRFCLVGGANTLIDVLTLNVLLWGLPTTSPLMLVLYNSVAYSGGAVTSFFLNKYWTFGHKQKITGRIVRRFAILLVLEILYSNGLVWLAGRALQPFITNPILWGNAAKILAVAGSATLSYAGMRFWAFAARTQDIPQEIINKR